MSNKATARYLSATDTTGSRIRVTWRDDSGAVRTYTESYDYAANDPFRTAVARALNVPENMLNEHEGHKFSI